MKSFRETWNELNNLEEYNDSNLNDGFNDDDSEPITEYDEKVAEGIFRIIQDIINQHDDKDFIVEGFTSTRKLREHFTRYCIGESSERSTRQNVRYDFRTIDRYSQLEQQITSAVNNANSRNVVAITTLHDSEILDRSFHKLFEGELYLVFTRQCGFQNTGGPVSIVIHAYTTSNTTNYSQNTVDFMVINRRGRTATLYPIDANYLENKINKIIRDKNPTINIQTSTKDTNVGNAHVTTTSKKRVQ